MSILRKLIKGEALSPAEYAELFTSSFESRDNKLQMVALLSALSAKTPTSADIINFVRYLHTAAPKKELKCSNELVNIVGTGGGISTFNISTTTVFVAAAAGAKVLKSGSHSYNSKSGSLDVLAQLGIDLSLDISQLDSMLSELNLGFVSPKLYPPMLRRIATSILPLNMKDIGGFINTVGPLLCPIKVDAEVCGVRSQDLLPVFAQALKATGIDKGFCVCATAGLDEFSAVGTSRYLDIADQTTYKTFQPYDYDMRHNAIKDLDGGTPKQNAALVNLLLQGKANKAATDTVIINAAFACVAGNAADDLESALEKCTHAIYSGASLRLLKQSVEFSHDHHAMAV